MNNELLKQLKEAGFPFRYSSARQALCKPVDLSWVESTEYGFDIPPLDELIEACGNNFLSLDSSRIKGTSKKWIASGADAKSFFRQGEGYTPSEAVLRLWLELNKK